MSTRQVDEGLFEDGIGFDGSSIRGFQTIDESDMLLIPDANTAFVDPIFEPPPSWSSAMCMTPSPAKPIPATRATCPKNWWNNGGELGTLGPNLGGPIPPKRGYFPAPPADTLQDLRSKMVLAMESVDIEVEAHHHEVATAAQCEIDLRFNTLTLLAFAAPTTNSYRRLVPGYEAPINLVYSQRNHSAICHIPMYFSRPKAKRVEFRAPDPSCNP